MGCKSFMPMLVLAVVSASVAVHPRFRSWLPTFDYQFKAGIPTRVVYTSQQRPSDRPTMNWLRGSSARGAVRMSRKGQFPSASLERRLEGVLRIRDQLINLIQNLSQLEVK